MKTIKLSIYALTVLLAIWGIVSCEEKETPKSDEKQITALSINKTDGMIDENTKTITVALPFGTNLTSLAPTITLSSKAKVAPASGVLLDLSSPAVYTVTAEDGSTQKYTVVVTLMANSEAKITSFIFSGLTPVVTATINETDKTITAVLPKGTDPTALSPAITVSEDASISPASGEAQDFSSPVVYKVTAADGTEATYTANIGVTKSSDKQILSFKVNEVSAAIDEAAKTITCALPYGTDVTALSPVITVSEDASISPASGEAHDFTAPATYTVTAEDGSTEKYMVVVTLMANSEAKITSFVFSGLTPAVTATINETDKTITAVLPKGTDPTALAPVITVSEDASISPSSGEAQDFSSPVVYKVTAEDGTEATYTVDISVTKSSDKQILSFKVNEVNAAIDEAAKTITCALPYGTDVTALSPVITVSEDASLSPASGEAQDFTVPATYTVTAEDGSTVQYTATITIKAFETSITGVSSTILKPGATITINGEFAESGNVVELEGNGLTELSITSEHANTITAVIPQDIAEGEYILHVTANGTKATHTETITIAIPAPVINSVTPATVSPGETITISGENFAAAGNKINLKGTLNYNDLVPATETETVITLQLPAAIEEGEYTVEVNTGKKQTVCSNKIEVTDPTKPRLLSLKKRELIQGIDDLVITGVNLENPANLYIERGYFKIYSMVFIQDDNTATYSATWLNDFSLGEYDVWLVVGENEVVTNKLSFTLIENTTPAPVISSVDNLFPCRGTNVVITGDNFGVDAVVKLDRVYQYNTPDIVSQTSTQIIFKTDDLYREFNYTIKVISNGKTATFNGDVLKVQECPPVFSSLNKTEATAGDEMIIKGNHFIAFPTDVSIIVGGKYTTGKVQDNTTITFTIPEGVTPGETDIVVSDYGKKLTIPITIIEK